MESKKIVKDMTPEERRKYFRQKMLESRRRSNPLKNNKIGIKNMSLEEKREYYKNKMRESRKNKFELKLKSLREDPFYNLNK